MKALRLVATQDQASYRRQETVANRMTYPLPQPSTVIGAVHKACGYREYHPMDVSIQGDYKHMNREMFRRMCMFDRLQRDRGTLIWMPKGTISNAGVKIGKAIAQGADFVKRENVSIYNEDEYSKWLALRVQIKQATADKKKAAEDLKRYRKQQKEQEIPPKIYKSSEEYRTLMERDAQAKKRTEELQQQMDCYRSVEYIPTQQEVLTGVRLIIHLRGPEDLLRDIYDHRYNIKAIGRSEDFVNLESADFVKLDQEPKEHVKAHHAYLKDIECFEFMDGRPLMGTKYLLDKNYIITDQKRVFEQVPAMYTSNFRVKSYSPDIWNDPNGYIVNFL